MISVWFTLTPAFYGIYVSRKMNSRSNDGKKTRNAEKKTS